MSKSVPAQQSSVGRRSRYRSPRSLVAVLLVAVASLGTTVAVLAIDDDGPATKTSSVTRSYPTLADPFHTRTQPTSPESRPDESAIASAISQAESRSYPTLEDPFRTTVEQPRPQGGPDESRIAAWLSGH
jgi:hypothetical protein